MMSEIKSQSHHIHPTFFQQDSAPSSELAIIEIIARFHDKISQINAMHAQGLQSTSDELEKASAAFLEDLKKIFEAEKTASQVSPIFKALEYAASFMSIALGIGLCATGTAAVVGSIMIATGLFGCIHTTMELTRTYDYLASLTSDRHQQDIIKTYLPAIIATTLALTATVTSTYCATAALPTALDTIRKFLPLMMQSLQTTQAITKGVFDFHKNKAESKQIEHEALVACLETILEEQKQAMVGNTKVDSKMNQSALQTLKVLTSLYTHI